MIEFVCSDRKTSWLHQRIHRVLGIRGMSLICHKNTKGQFKQEWNFKKLILTKWVLGRYLINRRIESAWGLVVSRARAPRGPWKIPVFEYVFVCAYVSTYKCRCGRVCVHSARDKLLGLYDLWQAILSPSGGAGTTWFNMARVLLSILSGCPKNNTSGKR